MNTWVFKKVIFLLPIVLFIFSLSGCKTIKAAVSFQWGKRIESEHHLEAKKPKENITQPHTQTHG
jgi:hypothetical protein